MNHTPRDRPQGPAPAQQPAPHFFVRDLAIFFRCRLTLSRCFLIFSRCVDLNLSPRAMSRPMSVVVDKTPPAAAGTSRTLFLRLACVPAFSSSGCTRHRLSTSHQRVPYWVHTSVPSVPCAEVCGHGRQLQD